MAKHDSLGIAEQMVARVPLAPPILYVRLFRLACAGVASAMLGAAPYPPASTETPLALDIEPGGIVMQSEDLFSEQLLARMTSELRAPAPTALSLAAARGESESALLVVQNRTNRTWSLKLEGPYLRNDTAALAIDSVEYKHVLLWYQADGAWTDWRRARRAHSAVLVPEILANDPNLVGADRLTKSNVIKTQSLGRSQYRRIIPRNRLSPRSASEPVELTVRDADTFQPFSLPPRSVHHVLITITAGDATAPGNYKGVIIARASDGKVAAKMPVNLSILPFALPPPALEYSIYYRGRLAHSAARPSSESKTKAQLIADYECMKRHGIENPTIYQRVRPKYAAARNQTMSARELLREHFRIREHAGYSGPAIYYLGSVVGRSPTPVHRRQLASDADVLRSIVGNPKNIELYFYGFDEAKAEGIARQISTWRALRKRGVKIFVAGSPGHTSHDQGLTDLLVLKGPPEEPQLREVQAQHLRGNRVFMYSNPQSGPENPLMWRKNYGVELWAAGYDGAMPFAFQMELGSPWDDWDHPIYRDHMLAYPGERGPISTLALVGLREAIDDVRYLTFLEKIIASQESGASRFNDDLILAARSLIHQLRSGAVRDPRDARTQCAQIITKLVASRQAPTR